MISDTLRDRLQKQLRTSGQTYRAQRAYVALMFDVIGRLLEASSETDAEMQRELAGMPQGYIVGFSLCGDSLAMRVQKRGIGLVRLPSHTKPDLDIAFKHLSHAFHVLSFQESTAQAFANDRAITQGDIALAMRFVRCLNRMQAIALPRIVATRALKAVPAIEPRHKQKLVVHLYGRLARGLLARSHA